MTAGAGELTERDFQRAVIELARLLRWRCAHFRAARTQHGWRTPVEADGAGYPDLHLLRERSLFIELKAEKTHLRDEQRDWLRALLDAGAEAYVARPSDLDALAAVLQARERPAETPLLARTLEALEPPRRRAPAEPVEQLAIDTGFDDYMRGLPARGQAR
jgi:hypothetical protein